MKKRFLLLIISIISVFSLTTFALILNYLDPYSYTVIAIASIIFTFNLGFSTFLTVIIYLFKKVYFRGRVHIYHVLSSFRQGLIITVFVLSLIVFNYLGASIIITGFLLFILFSFLELFIQNLEK